ncbi:hypothetical protein D3C86_2163140 [compost metagenome]
MKKAFCILQAEAVDVAKKYKHPGRFHRLVDAKLARCLDRVDHVPTGICQAEDLRFGVLGLE